MRICLGGNTAWDTSRESVAMISRSSVPRLRPDKMMGIDSNALLGVKHDRVV